MTNQGQFIASKDLDRTISDANDTARITGPIETGAQQIVTIEAIFFPDKCHSFHYHPNQEEVIYVLEGELEQWIEDRKMIMHPGDSAFIPAGVVHASFNSSDKDVKILAILSPSRGPEGYEVVDVFDQAPWNTLRK